MTRIAVPDAVRANMRRALAAFEKRADGLPKEAVDLASRVSKIGYAEDEDLSEMARYFAANKVEKVGDATPEALAWLLHGGSAGRDWLTTRVGDWVHKRASAEVVKVDDALGLVMGYAIICEDDGEPYFDTQGDHIPEDAMMEAALDFVQKSRVMKEMHDGDPVGTVAFVWPMTKDVAKAFGLKVKKTGLMIAVKPDDPEVLEKFRSGEYTGFSIGGRRIEDEEVE